MANDPHFFAGDLGASVGEGSAARALALAPGLLLGNKYRLLRPAGFGGMGAVWVARNEATAAEVAVKVLLTEPQAGSGVDHEAVARFRREAHMAAQLYHRGIVRIFDLVELSFPADDGDSFVRLAGADGTAAKPRRGQPQDEPTGIPDALVLVMELLRGETLASQMEKRTRFSQEEALAIVLPLLSALAHAHAQGIVHRDLKPENVFLAVDPDGHVIPKILDFGISKLLQPSAPRITTDGAMMGTPSYMSPEQARGLPDVDARADVFAAGILLYECLSGENPFRSGSYHSVVAAILEREPEPLTTASPELWRVIKRALEKSAALRYADAGELASALQAAAQTAGVQTPESSGAYPARAVTADARVSMGDRSVPPAPFREPETTLPSIRVAAKKRMRTRATIGAVAIAVGLAVVAGLYARQSRGSSEGAASLPPAAAHAEPIAAEHPSVALPIAPPPSAAVPPAAAPAGIATVTVAPMAPEPAASAAPPPRAPRPPVGHAKVAPPAPPPPRSTVVRDPGF